MTNIIPQTSQLGTEGQNKYWGLADRKFADWMPLFDRMQTDADLVNMVQKFQHVPDVNGSEIANSIYLTLNDAAVFTWRVETTLNAAVEQVVVTCDQRRFDTAYVEDFIRVAYEEADKLLVRKGMFPLNPYLDQQNFRRGREAMKVFFHIDKKGFLIPDIMPWDTRYVTYEVDPQGLYWIAYKTFRSRDQIVAEYPEADILPFGVDIEVLYILSRESSELWVAGSLIKSLPNKLGYVPAIYRKVPMGSMLMDVNTIQFQGESGLFLMRDLLPEMNRLASIAQSLNLMELDHALQRHVPPEMLNNSVATPTVDEVVAPGTVNNVAMGGSYQAMPIGELKAQANMLHAMVQSRLENAGLNKFQMGQFTQALSAVALMEASQGQDLITLPRLANRGLLKQEGAEMLIRQVLETGLDTVRLGHKEWDLSKLKGDYDIEFKYSFKDPRLDAARQSLATAQRGLIPDRDIRINTLRRDDWERDESQLRWEEAERISPLIKLNRTRIALGEAADEGDPGAELELMMITLQMIPALKQAMDGLMTPNVATPSEVKPQQPMLPLMPQSQRPRGGPPKQAGNSKNPVPGIDQGVG